MSVLKERLLRQRQLIWWVTVVLLLATCALNTKRISAQHPDQNDENEISRVVEAMLRATESRDWDFFAGLWQDPVQFHILTTPPNQRGDSTPSSLWRLRCRSDHSFPGPIRCTNPWGCRCPRLHALLSAESCIYLLVSLCDLRLRWTECNSCCLCARLRKASRSH